MQLCEQYRPKSWAEVVGQDKALARLDVLRRRGLGGRSFWVSGKSGHGKTSIARLIAAEIADDWATVEIDGGALTASVLAEWDATARYAALGKGRAYIVNEAHRLTPRVIAGLLVALKRVPADTAWLFTTTSKAQKGIFDERIDASPLLSRCIVLALSERDVGKAFAQRCREIARKEGLDGQPLSEYVALARREQSNFRAMLQQIEQGAMMKGSK